MKLKVNDRIKIKDRNQILTITKITMNKKTEIAHLIDADGNRFHYQLKDLQMSVDCNCQIEKL